jgi:hypothetical protein
MRLDEERARRREVIIASGHRAALRAERRILMTQRFRRLS